MLDRIAKLVSPDHRDYFKRVMLHIGTEREFVSFRMPMVPIVMRVLECMSISWTSPEDFAEEIGTFIEQYVITHWKRATDDIIPMPTNDELAPALAQIVEEFVRHYQGKL